MTHDARPTLQAPDDDPYLWLEEIDGAARARLGRRANRGDLAALRLRALRAGSRRAGRAVGPAGQDPDGHAARRARSTISGRTRANPRGLWRAHHMASYRDADAGMGGPARCRRARRDEGEDWIWAGATTLPRTHDRAILRLSRGGGDAAVLREFDIAAKSFVADGFRLARGQGRRRLARRDHLLLVVQRLGEGMATRSGYARTVRLWRRGTPFEDAEIVFETRPEGDVGRAAASTARRVRRDWIVERAPQLLRGGPLVRTPTRARSRASRRPPTRGRTSTAIGCW